MYKNSNNTNILILDACRNNPFENWERDVSQDGLAPMSAPKGTFISFSTSPGKTALDGAEDNSPFLSALVNHVLTPNLKIEDVFKRIRSEVMLSTNNRQMPWETTSLVGDFYFIRNALIKQIIYDYMESIWDSYEKDNCTDTAEALVFIDV